MTPGTRRSSGAFPPCKCAGPRLGVKGSFPVPRLPQSQPGITDVQHLSVPGGTRASTMAGAFLRTGCLPPGQLCPHSWQLCPRHSSSVTLVSQGQVRESDNGPSTPQGGLGVHRGLCVKQGVTSTRVPSKVLPCSQNKQAVHGGAPCPCVSPAWDGTAGSSMGWTRVVTMGDHRAQDMEAQPVAGQVLRMEMGCGESGGDWPCSAVWALGCAGEDPTPLGCWVNGASSAGAWM